MASFFSLEAEEFDDGLEFSRRSDLAARETDYYHAMGYDDAAQAWVGPYHTGRDADDHLSPYFSHQYDLQHRGDEFDDWYRHAEQQEHRQSTGRHRSGAAMTSTDPMGAHYRISGLRISPPLMTNASRQLLSPNAPRTGSETRQHVMPERGDARDDQLMSGRAAGISTGALIAASAAPGAAAAPLSSSSSSVSREASAQASASASASVMALPAARPIANASRNIKFEMLQPHFERPLQEAALKFGVCTTLLKKICRKNGIANWPFRKICGLRKSIASMEKQVQYFDGEQKKSYAEQLRKLQTELEAYRLIGTAPTPEFIQLMDEEEERERDNQVQKGGDDAVEGEERAGSDAEEDDDDVITQTDSEEKQQRATKRVSPLQQPEPRRPDSPLTKPSVSKSSIKSSSNQAAHYSRSDSAWEYHDARSSGSGGRYDEHLHHDRVHSRPPAVVTQGYAPDHHAYDHHQHHQYQPERRPQQHLHHEQQHHYHHHHHFHHHQTQHQRVRPHPQGMSTIGIHQHALPSISALLHRQGRDPAAAPDARDDSSCWYYERRDDFQ